jgi:hypothetical protein
VDTKPPTSGCGSGGGGGGCPFGFGGGSSGAGSSSSSSSVGFAKRSERNPAALVELLRKRFNSRRDRTAERGAKVAGRLLGDAAQGALDELLAEPAELCCPITLALLRDPVIASDGGVYEKAAIAEVVRRGKLSPTTLEPLDGELVPAAKQRSNVLDFMAQRARALIAFSNQYAQPLIDKRFTVLGWALAHPFARNDSVAEQWAKHAEAVSQSKTHGAAASRFVGTALDRAQLYLSALLADMRKKAGAVAANSLEEQARAIAAEYFKVNDDIGRPMSSDVLAVTDPGREFKVRVRMMTGDEVVIALGE